MKLNGRFHPPYPLNAPHCQALPSLNMSHCQALPSCRSDCCTRQEPATIRHRPPRRTRPHIRSFFFAFFDDCCAHHATWTASPATSAGARCLAFAKLVAGRTAFISALPLDGSWRGGTKWAGAANNPHRPISGGRWRACATPRTSPACFRRKAASLASPLSSECAALTPSRLTTHGPRPSTVTCFRPSLASDTAPSARRHVPRAAECV